MLIGNKLFPYPILNRSPENSDYKNTSSFKLVFDTKEDGTLATIEGDIVFSNLHFELIDDALQKLLSEGKIKGSFIVECSSSTYRKAFLIDEKPQTLLIPAKALHGNVNASCFLYATENISGFQSEGFSEDYEGYTFDIDRFDILAADDGFRFKIEINEDEDNQVASIFRIISKFDNSKILSYRIEEKCITIQLPIDYRKAYDSIKSKKDYNNIAFAMIALPALAASIDDVVNQEGIESVDEILESYKWFNAVLQGFKRERGHDLDFSELRDINSLELAQIVFNYAACQGIHDFQQILIGMNNNTGSDEDEQN